MTPSFYRSILDHYPLGYAYYKIIEDELTDSTDYEIIEVNKKVQEITSMNETDLVGRRVREIFKDQSNWLKFYNSLSNENQDEQLEYYEATSAQYYEIIVHYPDQAHMVLFFRDSTAERKQQERYKLFADNTELQIWHLQDPYTYGTTNKAHAEFLGIHKKDLEYQKITDFFSPEEARMCIAGNKEVFKEKKKIVTKEWIISGESEKRLMNVLKTPKFNQQGEIEFISCSAKDITDEYYLQQEKKIKENILYSMIHFTEELLTNDHHYQALANSIEMLGSAAQVDRVYYWENHYDEQKKEWFTSQRLEWCMDGVTQQIDNPELQNNAFEEVGDFVGILAQNKAFNTHIKDMEPSRTKEILESQGIQSILVLPVFAEGVFKGFIGFDSCRCEREWTEVEISLLNSFVLLYEKAVEKNQMEQFLLQIMDNFDNFFNMIDDFLLVFDQEGTIINANDTVLRKLNYTREEIIGQSASIIHPKEKVEVAANRMQNIINGKLNNFSTVALTKEGKEIPIETHVSKGIWDGEEVFFSVSKDITDLMMSEEKFSKAFSLSGTSMVISTIEEGEFIEVNDAFLELIGYEREEIIGKNIDTKYIFRSLSKNQNTRQEIIDEIEKNQRMYNYEVELVTKEGEIKTGLCTIVSVQINNQPYFLTSIVDITESKLLTQKLSQAKKDSDIANKAKSQFLSHISHEIRTPMNAVIGYSNLLAATMLTEKQDRYIEGIKASTGMLMSIINDILDWSKIDADVVELENKKFNIDEVIKSVVEQQLFRNPENRQEKVKILVHKNHEVPEFLIGDYLRLQQILLNLLSNAVKFTEVGHIIIEVNMVERVANRVTLKFKVVDTGVGIAEEVIEDIFKPFKQSDYSSMSQHGGTGLGLAISQKIVKAMNGEIGVKSKLNEGSTFYFTVDFEIDQTAAEVKSSKTPKLYEINPAIAFSQLINRQVLVVDDNQINQDVLKEILEAQGVSVSLAGSGPEAINKVQEQEFDVVLMDLRMPKMDGYETTKEIRKRKSKQELPIIAVSASVSPEEITKCEQSGIQEFITKPIEKERLFHTINHLLVEKEKIESIAPSAINQKKVKEVPLSFDYSIPGIEIEKALNHLNQNKDLFTKILNRFKMNHENTVEEINRALGLGNRKQAIRLAHTIKGVSGELFAQKIYSLAAELESELMTETFDVRLLLAELEVALSELFSSAFFSKQAVEKEEVAYKQTRKVKIATIEPLLKKLRVLLQENDAEGIDYLEVVKQETKGTTIYPMIQKMDAFGEQYDFEGALNQLDEIEERLSKKEC